MMRQFCLIFTLLIFIFSILLSLSKGSTYIPFDQLLFSDNKLFNTIFFQLRLPRTLSAFTAGGLLAVAGSLIQLLFQNPLADPYVLGISGGGALAMLLMMLLGINEAWFTGGAWLGSLLAIFLVFVLGRKHHWQTQTLLLSGIAIACGFSACISGILLLVPDKNLHSMLYWLTGDLNHAHYPWLSLFILFSGLIISRLMAPGLNILSRGEVEAKVLGLALKKYRVSLYLLSSLFTAAAVSIGGCIGFVGLIVPQLSRKLSGYDHRITLPLSALLGGTLVTLADTFARTLFAPQQLPVGIVIALLGTPVFIWLLNR